VGFLEKHFSKVGQGDLDTFRESDAAGYDVTLLASVTFDTFQQHTAVKTAAACGQLVAVFAFLAEWFVYGNAVCRWGP
jgi:hypothetical protein